MVLLTRRMRATLSTTAVPSPAMATRSHGRFSSQVTAASVVWQRSTDEVPRAADSAARSEAGSGTERATSNARMGRRYQLLA